MPRTHQLIEEEISRRKGMRWQKITLPEMISPPTYIQNSFHRVGALLENSKHPRPKPKQIAL
jgi:hypothetical protein